MPLFFKHFQKCHTYEPILLMNASKFHLEFLVLFYYWIH